MQVSLLFLIGVAMSNHTPGPWEPTNSDDLDDPPGNVVCTLGDGWYVSSEHEPTRDSNEADARLIAAAPDLLDELQYRYDKNRCGCGHPACGLCKDDRYTLEVLRKVKRETE